MKTLVSLMALCLFASACQFQKDPDKDKVPAQDVKEIIDEVQRQRDSNLAAAITDSDISVTYEPLPTPHNYQMMISWPTRVPSISVDNGLYKTVLKGTESFLTTLSSDQESRSITIETQNYQGHIVSRVIVIPAPPKDFVILSKIDLNRDHTIVANRVFFYPESSIVTNGFNLTLEANIISVEKLAWISIIDKWMANRVTSDSRLLSGGNISVRAKRIIGSLSFDFYGINGSNGRDGALLESIAGIQTPKDGTPGSAGQNGTQAINCVPTPGFDNNIRFMKAVHANKCRTERITLCSQAPTNGSAGEDAPKAMDGEDGGSGGNTANLFLSVEEIESSITIRRKVGKGGSAGLAAPPRSGGQGGAAGAQDPANICPPAAPGANGANGSAGRDGTPGKDGQFGTLSIPTGEAFRHKIHVIDE